MEDGKACRGAPGGSSGESRAEPCSALEVSREIKSILYQEQWGFLSTDVMWGKLSKHPEIYPDLGVISMCNYLFQACNCIFSRKRHFKPVFPPPSEKGAKATHARSQVQVSHIDIPPRPPNPKRDTSKGRSYHPSGNTTAGNGSTKESCGLWYNGNRFSFTWYPSFNVWPTMILLVYSCTSHDHQKKWQACEAGWSINNLLKEIVWTISFLSWQVNTGCADLRLGWQQEVKW